MQCCFHNDKTALPKKGGFTRNVVTTQALFSFKAIATSAMIVVTIAGVPYVNFTKSAIIARTVVLTFRYAAANAAVYFMLIFVHHNKKPPFKVQAVWVNLRKIIDIFKIFLYNSIKE
jgi:hypothetical protein